jgi:hypothetical protein
MQWRQLIGINEMTRLAASAAKTGWRLKTALKRMTGGGKYSNGATNVSDGVAGAAVAALPAAAAARRLAARHRSAI